MKRIVFMVTVALVVALILVGGAASAQEPEAVSVQVAPTAKAIDGGRTCS
jgi:outer membrane murein-binding lipoprotein Lpp